MPKQIRLNTFHMFCPSGIGGGLWSHPRDRGLQYNTIKYWTDLAELAERGLFDGFFLADSIGIMDTYRGNADAVLRGAASTPSNDPSMLISAMAAVTKDIGFVVTGNVSYEHPYLLARKFSTLDHLTGGRMGFNIVTGAIKSGARAMGTELMAHDLRYDMADDYMAALYKLWEGSWDVDAVEANRESGVYVRPGSARPIDHDGKLFSVHGIHAAEPSPQRLPVLYQAGSSPRGRRFAGEHAEGVFLSGQIGQTPALIADVHENARRAGRDAESIQIMLAATVVVGRTDAEARDLHAEYEAGLDFEGALATLSGFMGQDLSRFDPDEPLQDIENDSFRALSKLLLSQTPDRTPTIRDIVCLGSATAKDAIMVGSPATVAEKMIAWVDAGADGFNLTRLVEPEGLGAVVDLLVPELQDRGYYKTAYAPGTYREKQTGHGPHLPADHPAMRYRR